MLIIHHWDTDGICSAAMIAEFYDTRDFENISPRIGDFSFDERIEEAMERHDRIFIVDLNLTHLVKDSKKEITFIDHHIQEIIDNPLVNQINPVSKGGDPTMHPSCSTVISDHFDKWSILSVLGAIGDIGTKAEEHPKVRDQISKEGISSDELELMVSLIDSNYLTMDRESVEHAVKVLLEKGPKDWLENPLWNERLKMIQESISETLEKRVDRKGYCIMDFSSPYNIISKVARKAVWEIGYGAALAINRDLHGNGQEYLRVNREVSSIMDIPSLIESLKDMGINAGGKKEVVGSVFPKERMVEVHRVFIEHIEKRLNNWSDGNE